MFPYEESDVPFLCDGKPGAIKSLQMTTNNFVIVMGFFFFNNRSSRWHVAVAGSMSTARVPRCPSKFLWEEFVGGIWIVKAREHLLPPWSHYHSHN